MEARPQPRYGCLVEEGGASRRNDERAKRGRRAASEWLPKSQGDEEKPKRPAKSPKTEPASEREKRPAQPSAKSKQPGQPKKSRPAKQAGQTKQSGREKGPRQAKPADRRRRRDEHVHAPTDVDALGQDKHRKVIGQHNPNRGRQLFYYGIFIAFIVVAYVGLSAAVDQLDKAPAHDPAQAPWAQRGAPQIPLGGFEPRKQGRKGPTHFQ